MPVYEFECPTCHLTDSYVSTIAEYDATGFLVCTCIDPPTQMRRVFSFAAPPLFEDHYNMAAGKYIRSKRELDDHYKSVNDSNAAKGRPSNIQAIDRAEVTASDMGVSEILPERPLDL